MRKESRLHLDIFRIEMRKNLKSDSIAICLFAAIGIASITSAVHGLSITSHSTGTNSPVARHTQNHGLPSLKATARKQRTAIYGKIHEFKDINIEDVLLEAESALKVAQTSLVEENSDTNDVKNAPKRISEFKDINIEDVLLEAENALKVAEVSIVDKDNNANGKHGAGDKFAPTWDSVSSVDMGEVTDIVSSTLGGILLGSILGSVAAFQLYDVGTLDFSARSAELAVPIAVGVGLGGVAGLTGSSQDNLIGTAVRGVLGAPTKALASAMVNGVREAGRRQVEKATNDIRQSVSQKAEETKLAVDQEIAAVIEKAKFYLIVLTVFSSLVVVGMMIMNGELAITNGELILG